MLTLIDCRQKKKGKNYIRNKKFLKESLKLVITIENCQNISD